MKQHIVDIFKRSAQISFELYKIMVPILIGVKILQELDLIGVMAAPLAPIMHLAGLPEVMGLVWATAIINNIYSALVVFVSLVAMHPMTTAQVTVLGVMALVAHALPVELQIARKAGAKLWFQAVLRLGGAILLGFLLSRVYAWGNWLQAPATLLWTPEPPQEDLVLWIWDQCRNLGMIFCIISGLNFLMYAFSALHITDFCVRILAPVLRLLGIGTEAGPLTIVGMIMGLSYGGGIIMHEARSGRIASKDVFFAISLMGLAHSLFEDTLLLMLIGGHISGLLWARLFFAFVFTALLVRFIGHRNDRFFVRYFFHAAGPSTPLEGENTGLQCDAKR